MRRGLVRQTPPSDVERGIKLIALNSAEKVKNLFQENFFQDFYLDSKERIKTYYRNNQNKQKLLESQNFPLMLVSYNYDNFNYTESGASTPPLGNILAALPRANLSVYKPIVYDHERDIQLKMAPLRISMEMTIEMYFRTKNDQVFAAENLFNFIDYYRPYFAKNTRVYYFLPDSVMKTMKILKYGNNDNQTYESTYGAMIEGFEDEYVDPRICILAKKGTEKIKYDKDKQRQDGNQTDRYHFVMEWVYEDIWCKYTNPDVSQRDLTGQRYTVFGLSLPVELRFDIPYSYIVSYPYIIGRKQQLEPYQDLSSHGNVIDIFDRKILPLTHNVKVEDLYYRHKAPQALNKVFGDDEVVFFSEDTNDDKLLVANYLYTTYEPFTNTYTDEKVRNIQRLNILTLIWIILNYRYNADPQNPDTATIDKNLIEFEFVETNRPSARGGDITYRQTDDDNWKVINLEPSVVITDDPDTNDWMVILSKDGIPDDRLEEFRRLRARTYYSFNVYWDPRTVSILYYDRITKEIYENSENVKSEDETIVEFKIRVLKAYIDEHFSSSQ